ncbi:hypothetical protein OG21DRAFT_1602811 [Imleria badia]|nr:hypothetical protein OG21DRAFT_1602811 [Imleria badia]
MDEEITGRYSTSTLKGTPFPSFFAFQPRPSKPYSSIALAIIMASTTVNPLQLRQRFVRLPQCRSQFPDSLDLPFYHITALDRGVVSKIEAGIIEATHEYARWERNICRAALCGASDEPCRTHPRIPRLPSGHGQRQSGPSQTFLTRLQKLVISASTSSPEWGQSSVLFNGDTPALRTLELRYCPVSWYSFKLSGLTTLCLRHVPVRFQQRTEEPLATLRCMQDLKHLYLHNSLVSAARFRSSGAFNTFQKIDLPYLPLLLIAAPLSTVIVFLSCVNIPLKTELGLECDSEDHSLLSSFLARRSSMSEDRALSSTPVRSLVVDFVDGGATVTFSASERNCDSFNYMPLVESDCNIPLKIIVHFGRPMTSIDIWNDRDSTSVHVTNSPSSLYFWRNMLEHLPNLRYLKLSEGFMPDLASALSFTPGDYTENQAGNADLGPDRVLVPALEELELLHVSFFFPTPLQPLYDALSSRQESQGQLTMAECIVNDRGVYAHMVGREDGHFRVVKQRWLNRLPTLHLYSDNPVEY